MAASHDQYHDGDGDGRGRESRARIPLVPELTVYVTDLVTGQSKDVFSFVPLTTYGKPQRTINLGVDAGLCQFLKATFGPVIGATGSDSERGQTPAARLR
jgi:hypothetical protein